MKKRLVAFVLLLLIGLVCGCDSFWGDVPPLVVILSVNGSQWNGGQHVESRPDYKFGAIMATLEIAGGDPSARYRVEYLDDTSARERWLERAEDGGKVATTLQITSNQTVRISSGRAVPVSYTFEIVNNPPMVLSPWLSDATPEMGAHLRVDASYHQWGTCPTIQEPYYTGCYDADEEYGDQLYYRLRITGPKKASWEDLIQYRLYNDLPGTNEYKILDGEWLPVETQTHFFCGYDGPAPGIGALSAKDGGCGVGAQIMACPNPDDPPVIEDPWPSGVSLRIEVWVKDSMGEMAYGKYFWEIYVGGCP